MLLHLFASPVVSLSCTHLFQSLLKVSAWIDSESVDEELRNVRILLLYSGTESEHDYWTKRYRKKHDRVRASSGTRVEYQCNMETFIVMSRLILDLHGC